MRSLFSILMRSRQKTVPGEVNWAGGITPSNDFDLMRSKNADLITLPRGTTGTNCLNCLFHREVTAGTVTCVHPTLHGIQVNEHMCCREWDAIGCIRPWEE